MSESKMGAKVKYCGHDGWFIADIFELKGVNVVRGNGRIRYETLNKPAHPEATHHLTDCPDSGVWMPDIGVFVVPKSQVKEIKNGAR